MHGPITAAQRRNVRSGRPGTAATGGSGTILVYRIARIRKQRRRARSTKLRAGITKRRVSGRLTGFRGDF